MTTKVSDERLVTLIDYAEQDPVGRKTWLAVEVPAALRELQEKRALVKECEEYLNAYRATLSVNAARATDLDALLARVRGENLS